MNSGKPILAIRPDEPWSLQCVLHGKRFLSNSGLLRLQETRSPSKIVVLIVSDEGGKEYETGRYTLNLDTLEWSSFGLKSTDS